MAYILGEQLLARSMPIMTNLFDFIIANFQVRTSAVSMQKEM